MQNLKSLYRDFGAVEAARVLGISTRTLYRKLRAEGVEVRQYRGDTAARVLDELKGGALSFSEIARRVGTGVSHARKVCVRLRDAGRVTWEPTKPPYPARVVIVEEVSNANDSPTE